MAAPRIVGVVHTAGLVAAGMASLGLVAGVAYSLGGAVFDLLVSLGWVSAPSSGAWSTPGLGRGTALAFLALIGMPLVFGVGGLVAGVVGAVLYNGVARVVGAWKSG